MERMSGSPMVEMKEYKPKTEQRDLEILITKGEKVLTDTRDIKETAQILLPVTATLLVGKKRLSRTTSRPDC